jgi:uncharacterized protein YecT (DUF1311 family)
MKRLALVLILLAGPAAAQSGPSFDCAKADNATDRAICKDKDLAKADRDMVAAYKALLDKLNGAAKDQLVKDQVGWIASRNRACQLDVQGLASCLKDRYEARLANLRAYAGGPYPFITEESLIKQGKLGKVSWSYDITYPRFDGSNADFSAVNARFADAAKKAASSATPTADARPDLQQDWSYAQTFALDRPPGGNAVMVSVTFSGYSGGAHGFGGTRCTLVDLGTGKAVGPQGVFKTGDQWLKRMTEIVGADLKQQFVDKPGFDEALEPANLAKLLGQSDRYCWTGKELQVVFNSYDVGPYAAGPYEVDISYRRLKPMLRPDGPIAP